VEERLSMRRLVYVPIIHSEPELGTLGQSIEEWAKVVAGESNWQRHKEVVRRYWQEIADYWEGQNIAGLKIFQDGLPADGEVGEFIVKSLADKGSVNHKIIAHLLERGATLIQTEDPEVVKKEYLLAKELTKRTAFLGSLWAIFRYRRQKDRLLKARDTYIIKRINESLEAGETGVCFLGAEHQILPNLPRDIEVIPLKDPQKVRVYHQKSMSRKWEKEVRELGAYLTMPIQIKSGETYD
jgi:hypothetical protein